MCTLINPHLSTIVSLPTKKTSNDLTFADIFRFIKTAEDIQNLLNDKKLIEEYKATIVRLEEEKSILASQLNKIKNAICENDNFIINTDKQMLFNFTNKK